MANWIIKLDLSDIWNKYQDDEDYDEFKEALIPALEEKVEEVVDKLGDDVGMEFEDMIEEIKNADDEEEFDYIWQDLYDWADENMVWLGTF